MYIIYLHKNATK